MGMAAALLAAASVRAQDFYTYQFTSTDGDTAFDGSTVTISDGQITTWDLHDLTSIQPALSPQSIVIGNYADKNNSTVASESITGYNTTTFDGSFSIDDMFDNGVWNGASSSSGGDLTLNFGDPNGNWNFVPNQSSVPDTTSTLCLLAEVAAAGFLVRRKSAASSTN